MTRTRVRPDGWFTGYTGYDAAFLGTPVALPALSAAQRAAAAPARRRPG